MASYDHKTVMTLVGLVDLVEQISRAPTGEASRVVNKTGSTSQIDRIGS